eukprot:2597131-Pyramimonas_sp.AAC.1
MVSVPSPTCKWYSTEPIAGTYPSNIPHPGQSLGRTHRTFFAPANHMGVPMDYSSPRPIEGAYP